MAFTPNIFTQVNEVIAEDVKDELRLQGHVATGALEDSFRTDTVFEDGNIVLQATSLGYIKELEEGVSASQINVSPAEFQRLTNWVMFRGMSRNIKEARKIAYFIVQKWKKEGKPLDTSRAFSETGEILHAVKITFEEWREKHADLLNKVIINTFTEDLKLRIKNFTV